MLSLPKYCLKLVDHWCRLDAEMIVAYSWDVYNDYWPVSIKNVLFCIWSSEKHEKHDGEIIVLIFANLVLYRLSLTGRCITIGIVPKNNRNSFPGKCGKSKTYAVGEVHLLVNCIPVREMKCTSKPCHVREVDSNKHTYFLCANSLSNHRPD